jgi:hypothetical protein
MDDPTEYLKEEDKAELKKLGWVEPDPVPPPVEYPPHLTRTRSLRRVALVASPTFLGCIPGVIVNSFAWWALLIWVLFTAVAVLWVLSIERSKREDFERQWVRRWRESEARSKKFGTKLECEKRLAEERKIEAERQRRELEAAKQRAHDEFDRAKKKDAEEKAGRDKAFMLDQLRPATLQEYNIWLDQFLVHGGVPHRRVKGEPTNFWYPKYKYLRIRPLYGENALNIIIPPFTNIAFETTGDHTGDSVFYMVTQGKWTTLSRNNGVGSAEVVHYVDE